MAAVLLCDGEVVERKVGGGDINVAFTCDWEVLMLRESCAKRRPPDSLSCLTLRQHLSSTLVHLRQVAEHATYVVLCIFLPQKPLRIEIGQYGDDRGRAS